MDPHYSLFQRDGVVEGSRVSPIHLFSSMFFKVLQVRLLYFLAFFGRFFLFFSFHVSLITRWVLHLFIHTIVSSHTHPHSYIFTPITGSMHHPLGKREFGAWGICKFVP